MLIDTIETPDGPIYVYGSTEPGPRPKRRRSSPDEHGGTAEESTEKAKGIPDRPVDAGSALIYGVPGRIIRERTRGG